MVAVRWEWESSHCDGSATTVCIARVALWVRLFYPDSNPVFLRAFFCRVLPPSFFYLPLLLAIQGVYHASGSRFNKGTIWHYRD